MKTKLEDYQSTSYKIRKLWEGIKELIGLENELKQKIESLQEEVRILEKRIGRI